MTKFKNKSRRHESTDPKGSEHKTQDPKCRAQDTKRETQDSRLTAPLVDQIEKSKLIQYVEMCRNSEQTAKTIELLRQNPKDVDCLIAIVRNPANGLILRSQTTYVLGYAAKAGVNVSCALDVLVDALNRLPASLVSASMHALEYFAEKGWCDDNAIDKVCEVMDNNGPEYALDAQRILIAAGAHEKTAQKVMEELVIRLQDINTDEEHKKIALYALKGIAENGGDISDALEQIKDELTDGHPYAEHGYILTAAVKNKRTQDTALKTLKHVLMDARSYDSMRIILGTLADSAEYGISIGSFVPRVLEIMAHTHNSDMIKPCADVLSRAQRQGADLVKHMPTIIERLAYVGSLRGLLHEPGSEVRAAENLARIIEQSLSDKKIQKKALEKCSKAFNGLQPREKRDMVRALSKTPQCKREGDVVISKLVPIITESSWMYELSAHDTLQYIDVFADLMEINGADLSKCVSVLIVLLKANALNDVHKKQVKDALAKAMQNCDDNTKRAVVTEIREIVQSKKFNVEAEEYKETFVVLVRDIAEIMATARDAELTVQKNIAAGSL